jgi:hypothetical protein
MTDVIFNGNVEKDCGMVWIDINFVDSKNNTMFKYLSVHKTKKDLEDSIWELKECISNIKKEVHLEFDLKKGDELSNHRCTRIFIEKNNYAFYYGTTMASCYYYFPITKTNTENIISFVYQLEKFITDKD